MFAKLTSSTAALATIVLLGAGGSASAQGFFDQLFGTAPQSAPSSNYSAPVPYDPGQGLFPGGAPFHKRHVHKKVAAVDPKPSERQQPTDLMHDKTLHVGDAVMMKDGIHVYTGGAQNGTHSPKQFVALDSTHAVAKSEKERLASLDPVHAEPAIQEARSSTEVVNGFKITDAHGNSVRYVGP